MKSESSKNTLPESKEQPTTSSSDKPSCEEIVPNPFNYEPMYDGYNVYHWPEFQALIKRLGVAEPFLTRGLTIRVAEGEVVEITHTYIAVDTTKPKP